MHLLTKLNSYFFTAKNNLYLQKIERLWNRLHKLLKCFHNMKISSHKKKVFKKEFNVIVLWILPVYLIFTWTVSELVVSCLWQREKRLGLMWKISDHHIYMLLTLSYLHYSQRGFRISASTRGVNYIDRGLTQVTRVKPCILAMW